MPSPTKAELLAENRKLVRRIAALERAKQKGAAAPAEIRRLRAELRAAEQRQAATAKILDVIASSPADTQPVFNAIAENSIRLLGGRSAVVTRVSGENLQLAAFTSTGDKGDGVLKAVRSVPLSDASDIHCRVVRSAAPEFHADTEKDSKATPEGKAMARARGFRSVLSVPMIRDGKAIGTIGVTRARAGAFTAREIGLMTTFADQAVIAIENVRLFNETKQALERQTATAEILRVISSSPNDTQPVFDAIARTGARLVNGMNVAILLRQGQEVVVAGYSAPGREDLPEEVRRLPLDREKNFPSKVILDGEILHIPDWEGDDIPEFERSVARAYGVKAVLQVPMLRNDEGIGALVVSRATKGAFDAKDIALLKSFADQAVIAIENVRLFNETKEALERQTATSEILRVIASSPSDVQPVFDAIAERAATLCAAKFAYVTTFDGELVHLQATYGPGSDEHRTRYPLKPGSHSIGTRVVRDGAPVRVEDVLADPEYSHKAEAVATGYRSGFGVPMMRNGKVLGAISLARPDAGPIPDKLVHLLQTFADQAVIAIENVRLFNETKESLEQQTASAEILKVISSSPTDTQPVFDAIVRSAGRVCDARDAVLLLRDGAETLTVAHWGTIEAKVGRRLPLTRGTVAGRAILEAATIQVEDLLSATDYPEGSQLSKRLGSRTSLAVPLLQGGRATGVLLIRRVEVRAFSEKQVAMLQTFADQAVIAIENVRLFNETKEALEQQTATSEILGVISSSPTDVQPVFDAIVESASTLFHPHSAAILMREGNLIQLRSAAGPDITMSGLDAVRAHYPLPFDPEASFSARVIHEARALEVPDTEAEGVLPTAVKVARAGGFRSSIYMPLVREGKGIGVIVLTHPDPGTKLTDKQLALLQTFAAQAVIAIENVRLFNETKEALERQTATAEILQVIASSPSQVQPVFDAIAASAVHLCESDSAGVFMVSGDQLVPAHTPPNPQIAEHLRKNFPRPVDASSIIGRSIVERRLFHVPDLGDPAGPQRLTDAPETLFRSQLTVPMIREGKAIGAISATRRRTGPFSDSQIELLKTFADQAVIAIENVRLFNETKEALERQTATAEILKVIASSPSDVQPVFDAIAQRAVRLIGGLSAAVTRVEGNMLELEAFTTTGESGDVALRSMFPLSIDSGAGTMPKAVRNKVPHFISDVLTDPESSPAWGEAARARGFRGALAVPMLGRDGTAIGAISVTRREAGPFPDHQISLLKTFADQAVIAIENVRLFNETKEGLEQQTAISEILRVISSSPGAVAPMLHAVAERAVTLCDSAEAGIFLAEGERLRYAGGCYTVQTFDPDETLPLDRGGVIGRSVIDRASVHIDDLAGVSEEEYPLGRRFQKRFGHHTILSVPLMREDLAIGAIVLWRMEVRPFSDKQIALVKTFADQAAIAIENVRLFNETKEALERQTATAEILRVIASSPSDVQPVFDAIVRSHRRLFGGQFVALALLVGSEIFVKAGVDENGDPLRFETIPPSWSLDRGSATGTCIVDARPVNLPDLEQVLDRFPRMKDLALRMGYRSGLWVPLIRDGEAIGVLNVLRRGVGEFSEHEVALGETFADQAVIAIENVRLFNETKEALERQTATAEILNVISASPTDTTPVMEAIVASAARLFYPRTTGLVMREGDSMVLRAMAGPLAAEVDSKELLRKNFPLPFDPQKYSAARAIADCRVIEIADAQAEGAPAIGRRVAATIGYRSLCLVPLVREGKGIGLISLTHPEPGRTLEEKQLDLLRTFADQAVIAIENVRLFNETKEALERQTATAEILRVIASSPSDVQPVFDAIAASALRLIGGLSATVTRVVGEALHLAGHTATSEAGNEALKNLFPVSLTQSNLLTEVTRSGSTAYWADTESDPEVVPEIRSVARARGYRSIIAVPMMREHVAIGTISVTRAEAGLFTDHQISLLETFASQAVIAIENVRLFNETKEALEQQTATAEILKVIGSSPTDTQPVFDAIVKAALRIFDGMGVNVLLLDGNEFQLMASGGNIATRIGFRMPLDLESPAGRALAGRCTIMVSDTEAPDAPARARENGRFSGFRSITAAPMFREGAAVGAITVIRRDTGTLSDKQMALLQTFADQAVIAIENVRLFKELEARTAALSQSVDKLTALGEVGQAISSTLDLETVLKTIVSRATQLTGLDGGAIYEYDANRQEFRMQIYENMAEDLVQFAREEPIRLGNGAVGLTGVTREPTQVPDTLDDSYQSERKEMLIRAGYRAVLAVPLLREDNLLGALLVTRKTPGPFAEETVALLKTFATQSAMAIQNARLFREIAEKGRQLETASRHKSDFLASMSHELRTPLNAILGFNELILAEIYGTVPEEMKEPLSDIQTSGKHLLRLINNVLDLAKIEAGRMELALAEYSVHDTVESVRSTLRPLAAEKGLDFVTALPDELPLAYGDSGRVTQCLMNLAGNSLKFTKQGKVEIVVDLNGDILTYRVNDTGIGIPPDKIGSLFTEFKQTDATIASEYGGTGLGLSISRKFIEMHGGRVWVESEVGRGSSFIFEVPLRVSAGEES